MLDSQSWDMERAAGLLLVLSAVLTFPGLMMFWRRRGHPGGAPRTRAYFIVERSVIISGTILCAIGFVLLERALENSAGWVLASIGATAYLFAAVLIVAAEALMLNMGYDKSDGLVAIYVVTAFLAQAAIGGALLSAGLLAPWIGWAAILWNLGCLIVLALVSRRDMYFPVLHSIVPLGIGIALLMTV